MGAFQFRIRGSRHERPPRKRLRDTVIDGALEATLWDSLLEKGLLWADSSSVGYTAIDWLSRRPSRRLRDRLIIQTVYSGLDKLSENIEQIQRSTTRRNWEQFVETLNLLNRLETARNTFDFISLGNEIFVEFHDFAPEHTERILGNTFQWHQRLFPEIGIEGARAESPLLENDKASASKLYTRFRQMKDKLEYVSVAGVGGVRAAEIGEEGGSEVAAKFGDEAAEAAPGATSSETRSQSDADDQAATDFQPPKEPPPSRYANFIFYLQSDMGVRGKELNQKNPLRVSKKYQLEVSVGHRPEGLKTEEKHRPIREPKQAGPVDILVTIEAHPGDFKILNPVQKLVLPVSGGTSPKQNAVFADIEPMRSTFAAQDLLSMRVRLYYEFNLLEVMEIRAEAVGPYESDERSHLNLPDAVHLSQGRVEQSFEDLEVVKPRACTLT